MGNDWVQIARDLREIATDPALPNHRQEELCMLLDEFASSLHEYAGDPSAAREIGADLMRGLGMEPDAEDHYDFTGATDGPR